MLRPARRLRVASSVVSVAVVLLATVLREAVVVVREAVVLPAMVVVHPVMVVRAATLGPPVKVRHVVMAGAHPVPAVTRLALVLPGQMESLPAVASD